MPGYFADAASPAATPAHSSRPETRKRERDGDTERQRHVGDGHARVGDVRRRDRGRSGGGDRRPTCRRRARPSHQAAPTPPTPSATAISARREVRGLVGERLERREQLQQQQVG